MAQTETKQRAARIPLDYFKRSTRLDAWRNWPTIAAVVVLTVGGWVSRGFVTGERSKLAYSRGPVASVHATWETNCDVCHQPFVPIGDASWATPVVGRAWSSADKCEKCHAGPEHHMNQVGEHTPSCAACHREHRGRDASMVQVADAQCVRCHADLAGHTAGDTSRNFEDVRSFEHDHPEFRVLRGSPPRDPGKLKFNHALHMSRGMTLDGADHPRSNFTLAHIADPDARERYRRPGQKDAEMVQLECASCHRLEAADFGLDGASHRAVRLGVTRHGGATMLPITYESQCRACHPLNFDPALPNVFVPHGLQRDEVGQFVASVYAAQYVKGKLAASPGQTPFPTVINREVAEMVRDVVADKVREAERILFTGRTTCAECHYYESSELAGGNASTQPAVSQTSNRDELSAPSDRPGRIAAPAVPEVWFRHAVFDHAAHRALTCRECHERAFPDSPHASGAAAGADSHQDVLLPGIDTCRRCHSEPTGTRAAARGGARTDCTECHRYHNGDHPLEGIGAVRRDARAGYSIKEFINGVQREQPIP
jgi:hypothetical protein